ncbi:unnamed protein product [Dicrocoelium dendriticum]|nr:unnamed protein product [Dicrocoelium dendriticum]
MGLAIGGQGSNIRAARELPGVVSVRLRESDDDRRTVDLVDHGDAALFIVEAKTPEAAKLARAKLEFTELYLGVPRRYVGRLIGRRTNNIQSIINKSGVVQIHFDDHIKGPSDDEVISNLETLNLSHSSQFAFNMRRVFLRAGGTQPTSQPHADEEYGGFILSGTRDSVEKAKLLISFQLDYIFDLEKMEAEKNAIMSNLSYTNTELGGGYAPRGYLDGPGRFGDRGGAGIRGIGSGGAGAGRGIRRPPRRNYPAGNFDNGFVDGPRPSEQYADDGPAPFGNSRRPPRDPRSTRGYNGESRIGRARGGRMRRGIGAPRGHTEWNDRTGTNGDVADRRRGSDDSDAMGSNLSHDIDSDEHDGIASYGRDNQPIKRDIGETTDEDNLPGGDESAGHNSNDNSRLRDSDRSNCNRYEYSNQTERPVRYNRPPRTRQTLQNGSSVSASSGSALKHTGATSVRQPTQA